MRKPLVLVERKKAISLLMNRGASSSAATSLVGNRKGVIIEARKEGSMRKYIVRDAFGKEIGGWVPIVKFLKKKPFKK